MSLELLIKKYKIQKIENPECAIALADLPDNILTKFRNTILSEYDLEHEQYATSEKAFYNSRRIVAQNKFNKLSSQIYTNVQFDSNLEKLCEPIINEIRKILPNSVPVLIQLATLLKKQNLQWHVDAVIYHQFTNKIHIPIISNDACFFETLNAVEKTVNRINLCPGKLYNINNLDLHRSINQGDTSRTHLVIDFMPEHILKVLLDLNIDFFHIDYPKIIEDKKMFFEALPKEYQDDITYYP